LTGKTGCVRYTPNFSNPVISRGRFSRGVNVTKLSHVDESGKARMVDVTEKKDTVREAVAQGMVLMSPTTVALIESGGITKGNVFAVAKVAGIMAAKKTSDIIPMCHPLSLTNIDIQFVVHAGEGEIIIKATVKTVGKTGVEMEALTAVSAAGLAIYDMCKAADRSIVITDIKLLSKKGGKSGVFVREWQGNDQKSGEDCHETK
jgi:cyclic pyranopterin phosphate synthase